MYAGRAGEFAVKTYNYLIVSDQRSCKSYRVIQLSKYGQLLYLIYTGSERTRGFLSKTGGLTHLFQQISALHDVLLHDACQAPP